MRRSNRRLGLVSLLALTLGGCGGGGSATPATTTPPATYAISGTITGASGVGVTLVGGASKTTTTDAAGAYRFSGLADGSYTVTPARAGSSFVPLAIAVTVKGADQPGKDFTATPGAAGWAVSGTVSGDLQDGITVTLSQGTSLAGTVNTSGGGAYAFSGVADGSYTLVATRVGYAFLPATLDVTVAGANRTGQDFSATVIPRTLAGHVTGTTGVTVTLDGTRSTITDPAGAWSLPTIVGTHTVVPTKGGYTFTPISRTVPVTDADVFGLDFTATSTAGY